MILFLQMIIQAPAEKGALGTQRFAPRHGAPARPRAAAAAGTGAARPAGKAPATRGREGSWCSPRPDAELRRRARAGAAGGESERSGAAGARPAPRHEPGLRGRPRAAGPR